MFDLEQSLNEWRRRMTAAGVKSAARLDELESHLREDVATLVSSGITEAEAFETAVERLGNPASLRAEFNRAEAGSCRIVTITSWLWVGLAALFSAGMFQRIAVGRGDLLLALHVCSIVLGYVAAFVAGGLGVAYIGFRAFHKLTPVRRDSLERAVAVFSVIAAGLASIGYLLGMFWAHSHWGVYFNGSSKEIAGACGSLWLIAIATMRLCNRTAGRGFILLSIGGNMVISLAWFAPFLMEAVPADKGPITVTAWLLAAFLGIQLVFLTAGLMPGSDTLEPNN
jgi:hypothetical protein